MLCQNCKQNQATIHLTEIVSGVRKETHLCESCAAIGGITVKSQLSINELLSGILASKPSDKELAGLVGSKEEACSKCGFTPDALKDNNLLGCPNDYEKFGEALDPLIKRAQNGQTIHKGKIPARTPEEDQKHIEKINLQIQLEKAVKVENYELAAELRDQITDLETKNQLYPPLK